MKLRLNGRRFDTTEEIHAESQEAIDKLTFENFQGRMKSWETRWDRCIHAHGDSGVPRNFFGVGGSTNSVEDRGQRERVSGGGSPLVRGFTEFANEWNSYSD
jgi:hypothetical protein